MSDSAACTCGASAGRIHSFSCPQYPEVVSAARLSRPRLVRFDERTNVTRRRGLRLGWLRWKQAEPPYHYEWRWLQAHVLPWDKRQDSPAFKVQIEVKTYRTAGMRSIDGSKRYLRFGVCL